MSAFERLMYERKTKKELLEENTEKLVALFLFKKCLFILSKG